MRDSNTNGCCQCGQTSEDELLQQLEEMLPEYANMAGGLIPALQVAQKLLGYLPDRALKLISKKLNISYSEVAGVVSFYSFFTRFPRGKYVVRVCLGTACYVRGGNEVLRSLKKELGIEVGHTTDDRLFSLDVGRCFGACGLAPVITVNDVVHQRVKAEKVGELLEYYKNKEEQHVEEVA